MGVRTVTQNSTAASRWPAIIATLATALLYLALPERLTAGPRWLLLMLVLVLMIPAFLAQRSGRTKLNFALGCIVSGLVTCAMIWSLGMLVSGLSAKRESPQELFRSATALWVSNILVFASWYWRLDAGGPHSRDVREFHTSGDFLFPQMTLPPKLAAECGHWKPGFVDYLFLAFNTSTAFSPTDVPILSPWAKMLMMIQAAISLGTIAILAARAVNFL
jgi:hypothetical protein